MVASYFPIFQKNENPFGVYEKIRRPPRIDAITREAFNLGMKRILAVLLLLTLAFPAWAQDYEKGRDAYLRGDYATALSEWRPLRDSFLPVCADS